ncbi:ABC transporter permease [Anaerocolumna xylanovorans]|uniref:Putative ABC transport system permease protein n=1 Tax=Anaerocolumna xylanovorans DSM 12503 TaxID=1121345 RepID=A0A1M7YLT8_9FIRM|nr:ABC transporter permease [Anaerocolumna xylanovorans]SHO53603.1 putative ABC transport system permease protein [Anaerocolumna xylanovorans DSM 12503]
MNLFQTFKLAIKSIVGNKLRSFLTMLGMIIGVTSVITLIGLMNGVTNYVLSTFSDMGTNMLTVSVTNTDTRFVKVDDVYDFVKKYSNVFEGVSPSVVSNYTLKYGTNSMSTTVTGVGEDYADLNDFKLSSGRFIDYADIKNRYKGCVIGTYIVDELFDGIARVGDTIRINGEVYTVIGIKEEEADSEENSADDCVYIPYSSAVRMAGTAISSYSFAAVSDDKVDTCKTLLDNYLYNIMKDEDLYKISTMAELLEKVTEMTNMMGSILGGIAGISLLVAGIGIMNIMLVSVVERTKEIGIRKSLGAKRKDILLQFVIEAATISILGGTIGIILGWAATTNIGNAFGLDAYPTVNSILLAFGVSAGIGVGFGFMPANKAAKLNPIDALRTE